MPRPSLSPEDQKKLRAARNARYYAKKTNDERLYAGKHVLYHVRLPDHQCFIGSTDAYRTTPLSQPMLVFREKIDEDSLRAYQAMLAHRVGAANPCAEDTEMKPEHHALLDEVSVQFLANLNSGNAS